MAVDNVAVGLGELICAVSVGPGRPWIELSVDRPQLAAVAMSKVPAVFGRKSHVAGAMRSSNGSKQRIMRRRRVGAGRIRVRGEKSEDSQVNTGPLLLACVQSWEQFRRNDGPSRYSHLQCLKLDAFAAHERRFLWKSCEHMTDACRQCLHHR